MYEHLRSAGAAKRATVTMVGAAALTLMLGVSGIASNVEPAVPIACTHIGTGNDDVIFGTAGPDVICGYGGNDRLVGLGGQDLLLGGPGDDILKGGPGRDTLNGAEGADVIRGGAGDDHILGGPGDDDIRGDAGDDLISGGDGNDHIVGGRDDDFIYGWIEDVSAPPGPLGRDRDTIKGGLGSDIIRGDGRYWSMGDDDLIIGGAGRDDIVAAGGNDRVESGAGNDWIVGGPGADQLIAGRGSDWIYNANLGIESDHAVDILRGGRGWDHGLSESADDVRGVEKKIPPD